MKRKNFLCAIIALAVLPVSCSRTTIDRAPEAPETVKDDPYTVPFKWWAMEGQQPLPAPAGEARSLTAAYSDESRTYLEMNGAGTEAAVIWSAGDEFYMFGYNSNGLYSAPYSTAAGGAAAKFTTEYGVPSPCYSFYPDINDKYGFLQDGTIIFSVNVPHEQTAVEGSFAPEANISYAYSESQTSDLHFINLVSLVRFRISGAIASEIKSVALSCSEYLSGDLIAVPDEYEAFLYPPISFTDDVKYTYVTLNGDFRAGVDYYIAVAPTGPNLITLSFENGVGRRKAVNSTNEVSFLQGRICDLGTIDLGDSYDEVEPTFDPVPYLTSSKPYPVTLAVIPDGFTEDELDTYEAKARSGLTALFKTEPYKTYKDYFNVWILKVASAESGAGITDGKGNVITPKDTYFSSAWGENSYGDMSADEGRVFNFVELNCPDITDGSRTIDEVPILMIINDERYGGICWNWSNGQCFAMVPTTGIPLAWAFPDSCAVSNSDPSLGLRKVTDDEYAELGQNSGDWRNTLVHEFGGHAFGRLADEYWYDKDKGAASAIAGHSYPVPMSLNISTRYDPTPWDDEVLSRREALVAQNPLYSRIGVYQGGDVSKLNRWRSEKISCMIDNRLFFSTWQRMLIVKRIMSLAGESFDVDEFYANDHPEDPVRDAVSSPVIGERGPIAPVLVPPLPPVRVMEN